MASPHRDQHHADRPASCRTVVLFIGCSVTAFVLLALMVAAEAGAVLRLDAWISHAAHTAALAHPHWRQAMATITMSGGTAVLAPITAVVCLILLAYGRWRQAAFVAAATVVTIGVRLLVLGVVARPRPADQLAPASNYSFPSGHSTAAAAFALSLVLVWRPLLHHRWSRVVLASSAAAWAITVGVSRVALVVHWPSDIVGAWLLVSATVPATALSLRALLGTGQQISTGPSEDGILDPPCV